MTIEAKLYTTLGCHLCEDALTMLNQLNQNDPGINITEVEIADSDELMKRYGIRIPVVAIQEAEIGWPFSEKELADFIGKVVLKNTC